MATEFEINRDREQAKLDALLTRKNRIDDRYYNGIFDRYVYPVVTREMVPLFWKYDMNPETNPHFMERLGAALCRLKAIRGSALNPRRKVCRAPTMISLTQTLRLCPLFHEAECPRLCFSDCAP